MKSSRETKTVFFCQSCGHQSPKWLGKCPGCGEWNRFVEEELRASKTLAPSEYLLNSPPTPIDAIVLEDMERRQIGMAEMDRVLGGGIVQGSAVLVGGDPGIGKSTLLLQILQNLAAAGLSVLYISGEESANQIKMRGKRIGAQSPNILVLVEIALEKILDGIASLKPSVVVVDSIQTIYSAELSSAPGSVGQVRECSERLILLSKKTGIPLFLIGHVTKDGSIAGPKVLEHMVDTVLYFEGDSGHAYRIIRSIKNRFGPANEIGVFEMKDSGLAEVGNPSAFFLSERPEGAAGSVVAASMEGTRPILIEIQALAGPSNLGMPRRTVIGTDNNRVSLLVAVLEKICGMHLGNHDVFINIAGGVKVNEPGIDLGIVAAIASSFLNRAIDPQTVVFGEVGLTGEIRGIGRMEDRIKEAGRMGFGRCIFPKTSREDKISIKGMQAARVGKLEEFLAELF
jgi:DNA repair protein RadA/Sms